MHDTEKKVIVCYMNQSLKNYAFTLELRGFVLHYPADIRTVIISI